MSVFSQLNSQQRLEKLIELTNDKAPQKLPQYCNNHVHTVYSFSPYTPTEAVYQAYSAGLETVGIMDHDSVSGALEFLKAGEIAKMGVTVGTELRASFAGTEIEDRFINNPDQKGIAYMALHGIPQTSLSALADFIKPISAARALRNVEMVRNINKLFIPVGIEINYERDVLPLSQACDGGSVTERHLSYAVAIAICEKYDISEVASLLEKVGCSVSEAQKEMLSKPANDYLYKLLGVLKGDLVKKIYVDATAELPPISEVVKFCEQNGIILAYAYLGDVGQSVTGDKKAQAFEDSYLDLLFEQLSSLGIKAVTYMPARNTLEQLSRVQKLCEKYQMLEISGEDINMPNQSFICEKLAEPEFCHLVDSTYALIGHEHLAKTNLGDAIIYQDFSDIPALIKKYSDIGKQVTKNNR